MSVLLMTNVNSFSSAKVRLFLKMASFFDFLAFWRRNYPSSSISSYLYTFKTNPMETSEKKLFLLDAYALIYRAFFALNKNPRLNSKGVNTSAVMGFLNSLYEILKNEKPTHIGVAFDVAGTAEVLKPFEVIRGFLFMAKKAL